MAGTSFSLKGDASNLMSALTKSQQAFDKLNKAAKDSGQGIDDTMSKLKDLAGIAGMSFGAAGMAALAKKVADVRGEFQQLEIAFGTMLGSTDKANALMKQLANTAAKTPFDLQGIAQGAKQLIAYGTAAEEINSIIVSLGDVAAGLSLPLNDLVYLYGTTMVQGRMFTQDLKQLQGRGVPILEALSKQLGVAKEEVSEMVSAGRVNAEVFKKAMLSMSQEGGKFAGLMAAQSASITGQISNIQDGIDMMFNEIGQNTEGVINGALDVVSKLVDNYEKVGKALVALAGTYGIYKAALVVVTALENARNLSLRFSAINAGKQITSIRLLTASIWKQVTAQLASNAAMLANPAVAITIGLVALMGAIWGVCRAFEKNADATSKVNKKYDERIQALNDEKTAALQHIEVLEDETAAYYDIMKAKDALSKLELLRDRNIAGMTPEQIREALNLAYEQEANDARQEEIQGLRDALVSNKNAYKNAVRDAVKETALSSSEEAIITLTGYDFEKFSEGKSFEEQERYLNDLIAQYNNKITQRSTDLEWYDGASDQERARIMGSGYVYTKKEWEYELKTARMYVNNYRAILQNIRGARQQTEERTAQDNAGVNLEELKRQIKAQEEVLNDAREAYAQNTSIVNKTAVDTAEGALKTLTDKYQMATGKTWQDTNKMQEEITKATLQATNERTKISISAIDNERIRRKAEYDQQIKEIEQEEAAYKASHNGRTSGEFEEKKTNALAQYNLDVAKLDKQFQEWVRGIEDEVVNINAEMDISVMERAVGYATTYTDKIILQNALLEQQMSIKEKELDIAMRQEAESKFGKETLAKYGQYKSGKITNVTDAETSAFAEIDNFFKVYETRRNAMLAQLEQQNAAEMLDMELQNFEEYANGIIQAEQDYQEELKSIRERYGLDEGANLELSANANVREELAVAKTNKSIKTKAIEEKTGINGNEFVNELNGLGEKIAGKAAGEIQTIYTEFIEDLDQQIADLKNVEINKISTEQGKIDTNQERIAEIDTELEAEGLSETDKATLLQERATLEAGIAESLRLQAEAAESLNGSQGQIAQLTTVKAKAEQMAQRNIQSASAAQVKQAEQTRKKWNVTAESLSAVRDAADSIADTFGGALSQKGKKALKTISGIADFGVSAVKGIETVVNGVSGGMTATASAAAGAMSTVEKASVILTVISLAVQLIMKIVEIASQFTQGAQLQSAIDAHLEKVEDLQHENEKLQRAYQSKTGIDYYKGMTAAAKDYSKIIREQQKALADAESLYEHYKNKYGEDSDKTKDAKSQMQDIENEYNDMIDEQAEMFKEVASDLATTDLQSFSQSLAESIVEGFEQGADGIEDAFDDVLDDLYRSMLTKQLAMGLEKQFEPIFKKIEEEATDADSLTQSDIEYIMEMMAGAEENAKALANAYYDVFSEAGLLNDADAEASEGFGQMTQDQADTLTARFTAMQIEMANMSVSTQAMTGVVSEIGADVKLGVASITQLLYNSNIGVLIAQEQLDRLQAIVDNTAKLTETNNRLKTIEQNTSRI